MASQRPISIHGVILPDGTLELAQPHGLAPGPVQVSVVPINVVNGEQIPPRPVPVPLPDPPLLDTAISAPCDLPLTGPSKRIYPRKLDTMPLPEPHDIDDTME